MDTRDVLGQPYRPRIIDEVLTDALQTAGAVVIEGPRACGKTMTGLNAAASCVFMDDDEAQARLDVAPASLLDGASPRLLDEWQVAPGVWNRVRRRVDAQTQPGRFILTGSAVPADDESRHTGAGRFLRLRQRTLAWAEQSIGQPTVSLKALFHKEVPATSPAQMTLEELARQLVTPGFPAMTTLPPARAAQLLRAYLSEIARVDVARLAQLRHDPAVIERLLRALARASASETTFQTLRADVAPIAPHITVDTVASYVGLLERLFVVEQQPAWAPGLRTRARLRTSPRWHLADPALAAAALLADQDALRDDLLTTGVLFESAAVHDLSVLAEPLGGRVYHYRDSNGHELDAVVVLPDGRWGAVEVKLGEGQVPRGAASLAKAVAQIDGEPSFRLVLSALGSTYCLDDGTITCPLAALGP